MSPSGSSPTFRNPLSPLKSKVNSLGFPWRAPDWPTSVERPTPERGLGVDYDTAWARTYPARLARAVVVDNVTRPLAHAIATPRVRGDELLTLAEPPYIFVPNHTSHVDTALLLSVLPTRLRHCTIVAGAADYFFDRRWKAHMWALLTGAIPIERQRVNRRSADLATDLVDDGWSLLIYAEGGRSPDGWMQEFRAGAAFIAVRTGRPVVPIYIDGTARVMSRHGAKIRRSPTTVTFGLPMRAHDTDDARTFTRRIERAVHLLASEHSTDWWTARRMQAADDGTGASPDWPVSAARGPAAPAWRRTWALGPAPDEGTRHRRTGRSTTEKRGGFSKIYRQSGVPGGDWALKASTD